MPNVEIYGWRNGFKKVSCTQLLQQRAGIGLVKAKDRTDRILNGESVTVTLANDDEANRLVSDLAAIGADARILSSENDA